MRGILPILLGLLALIALAFLCARHHGPTIEEDLTTRAAAPWRDLAGTKSVSVAARGREVILTGKVASDELRRKLVTDAKVFGVRRVEDGLTVGTTAVGTLPDGPSTDGPSTDGPSTDGTATGGTAAEGTPTGSILANGAADDPLAVLRVTRRGPQDWDLSGTLASLDQQAIEQSLANGTAGLPSVTDWQTGDERAKELVQAAIVTLPWVHQLEQADLEVSPTRLRLQGRAANPQLALNLRSALRQQLASDLSVDIELDADWRPQDLQVHVADSAGRISLEGLIPRGDLRQRLNQAASQVRGMAAVDDALIECDLTAPPGFGQGVEAALAHLSQLRNARVSETVAGLTVQGLAAQADPIADSLRSTIAAQLPPGRAFDLSVAAELARSDCQGAIDSLLAANNILFDSGSARISAASESLLQKLASTLLRCPGYRLKVAGHTDSDGDAAFNRQLSSRRADAVQQRLMTLGVAGQRISSTGHGEEQPIAQNDTPEGKAQNRRIEFQLEETS